MGPEALPEAISVRRQPQATPGKLGAPQQFRELVATGLSLSPLEPRRTTAMKWDVNVTAFSLLTLFLVASIALLLVG